MSTFGLRLGLGVSLAATGPVAGTPTGALATIEILAATPLLDATGDYSDATTRIGVNGNGWVAKATMPYLVGQTFDPTKVTLTVSDPGYDGTGTTTVSRSITGRAVLRRQYNAALSNQLSNDGITFTVYFSLSDDIYQGSTITAAATSAGFYGASAAGSIPTKTNSSTLAYPKALFAWLNLQHERWTGDTLVEAVAYHRHAMNGRQVARIEFIASDAQVTPNTAATQTANTVALSTLCTQGNPPEVYSATIPLAALTQADLCLVNAKVYPWIGDSSAVLDLVADGVSTSGNVTTAKPRTPLRFLNDKSGTYGGAIAYVKAGAGGTPQVSLTGATARANPYASIDAALAAIKTFNNANRGHNDHSGADIYLMDDGASGAVAHVLGGGSSAVTAGKCWTNVRPDPLATGAVSVNCNAANRDVPDLLRWMANITMASGYYDGGNSNGNVRQALDGMTVTVSASPDVPIFYRMGLLYQRNVTWSGLSSTNDMGMAGYSTTRTQCALALGVVNGAPTANITVYPYAVIGCSFRRTVPLDNDPSIAPNMDGHDTCVVANNKFLDMRASAGLCLNYAIPNGFALVQNVFERAVVATSPALQLSGDGSVQAVDNIVDHHNTIVGERTNRMYADVAGAAGVIKRISSRFNIWYEYNCKSDTFTGQTTVTGRVGNWRNRYTVSHLGNVCLTGAQSTDNTPATNGSSWLGEAWPAATYNVGAANVTFTNDQSLAGGNAGNGTYTLAHGGTDAAINQVPAGLAVLSYDLAGTARPNNGTGAAGAYQ